MPGYCRFRVGFPSQCDCNLFVGIAVEVMKTREIRNCSKGDVVGIVIGAEVSPKVTRDPDNVQCFILGQW